MGVRGGYAELLGGAFAHLYLWQGLLVTSGDRKFSRTTDFRKTDVWDDPGKF